MQTNVLSVVNVISLEYVETINALAAELGMGADCIRTELQDSSGNKYFCCHSWWTIEKYSIFKSVNALTALGIDMSVYLPAIDALYEFVIDTTDMPVTEVFNVPAQNFNNALTTLGLTRPEVVEQTQE